MPVVVGVQRCFDPECDSKLKKALLKQAGICCGILAIPTILFIIILSIIIGEATFSSPYYNVSKEYESGTITCTPKAGPHTSTLIFLHPLNEKASEFLNWFIKENEYAIAPRDMKLIFPQADKQRNQWYMNQYGQEEPVHSWFDEFEGKNASAYTRSAAIFNSTELEERQRAISNVTKLITASDKMVRMLEREAALLPSGDSSRVFIGGVGQGAMLSLSTYLRWSGNNLKTEGKNQPLGGVIGFLGYEPLPISNSTDWLDT